LTCTASRRSSRSTAPATMSRSTAKATRTPSSASKPKTCVRHRLQADLQREG
jgi:hypothetical protein